MAKKELTAQELAQIQQDRLEVADISLTPAEVQSYLKKADDIGINEELALPIGFKRCGKCRHILKFFKFNKNNEVNDKCTGSCKECQRGNAKKSYTKTKKSRDYKKYYAEHKEEKLAKSKQYYKDNKEALDAKHQEYLKTKKGKSVMKKAREKRTLGLSNIGIPYTPEQVWERDCMIADAQGLPICYLCGNAMEEQKKCHIDHMIGIAIGGPNSFENVAYVHDRCNLTKSKDCKEVTTDMTEQVIQMTDIYIVEHPEDFK